VTANDQSNIPVQIAAAAAAADLRSALRNASTALYGPIFIETCVCVKKKKGKGSGFI